LIDYLLSLSTQPAWLFVAIILSSYILEDLAIIAAAILAADQLISVPLAASAIMLGIISGDIGLYIMGYWARSHKRLKERLLKKGRHQYFSKMLNGQLLKNILLIRFVPGLRFICYTSCGLFKVHPGRYVLGISLATFLWVLIVFSIIYQLGSTAWLEHNQWKWSLVPLAMLMLYFFNRHTMKNMEQT